MNVVFWSWAHFSEKLEFPLHFRPLFIILICGQPFCFSSEIVNFFYFLFAKCLYAVCAMRYFQFPKSVPTVIQLELQWSNQGFKFLLTTSMPIGKFVSSGVVMQGFWKSMPSGWGQCSFMLYDFVLCWRFLIFIVLLYAIVTIV